MYFSRGYSSTVESVGQGAGGRERGKVQAGEKGARCRRERKGQGAGGRERGKVQAEDFEEGGVGVGGAKVKVRQVDGAKVGIFGDGGI